MRSVRVDYALRGQSPLCAVQSALCTSVNDREAMRGKPCGICKQPMEQPCYDEVNGVFRGWLCHHCNIGLGQFREQRDLLFAAINYLDRHMLGLS